MAGDDSLGSSHIRDGVQGMKTLKASFQIEDFDLEC